MQYNTKYMNEDILQFLKNNNISVVSVVRPDNSVHAAALHFSNNADASEFYFATSRESRKAEGLAEQRSAKASVVVGFKEEEMITLQMDGSIRTGTDEEISGAMEIHYTKHAGAARFKDDPNAMFLIFKPDWWRFSKFKEKPPLFIESE